MSTVSTSALGLLIASTLVGAAASPASATEGADPGQASASVLRTSLDVGLLNKSVHVPLSLTLNEVKAPGATARKAERTALSATLDGVEGGKPFSVLRADVARAQADVNEHEGEKAARSEAELAHARVHVPGLPLLSVIEAEAVNARARCVVGEKPVATAGTVGSVKVLGQRVTLTANGPTHLKVPGVGEVKLELSSTQTTSRTAAASALRLSLDINPLDLGVAEVRGEITLVHAECRTPREAGEITTQTEPAKPPAGEAEGVSPQTEQAKADTGSAEERAQAHQPDLAATGADSRAPYLLGGALGLLTVGGALLLFRRHSA